MLVCHWAGAADLPAISSVTLAPAHGVTLAELKAPNACTRSQAESDEVQELEDPFFTQSG
jgi:hypothetical protein